MLYEKNYKIDETTGRTMYDVVTDLVKEHDGYCPCSIFKTPDTKCICKEFKESQEPGECHCGRFIKVQE